MAIDPLILAKRDQVLSLAAKHGAGNVRLFGSFARGQAREDSDVDLLVDAGPNTTPWFPGGLVADLQALLGRPINLVTLQGLNPHFRPTVLAECVRL